MQMPVEFVSTVTEMTSCLVAPATSRALAYGNATASWGQDYGLTELHSCHVEQCVCRLSSSSCLS